MEHLYTGGGSDTARLRYCAFYAKKAWFGAYVMFLCEDSGAENIVRTHFIAMCAPMICYRALSVNGKPER